jgi:hypothetical protein
MHDRLKLGVATLAMVIIALAGCGGGGGGGGDGGGDSTSSWSGVKQLGVAGYGTYGYGVALDSSGNAFVTGYTGGGLNGNTKMGTHDAFLVKYSSGGTLAWVMQLGATWTAEGQGVALDASGNAYVTGYACGDLNGNTRTGAYDAFLAKYSSDGTLTWVKQLSAASAYTFGRGVTLDSSGNTYVTGDTDAGLNGNTRMGAHDAFLAKYSSDGTLIYVKQLGVDSHHTYGTGVTLDSSGNTYVTGDTDAGLNGNTRMGAHDAFLAKYSSDGTLIYVKQLGVDSHHTYGTGVTLDSSGNAFVTGYTYRILNGNGTLLVDAVDAFLAKYSSDGTLAWVKQLGAASTHTYGYGVTFDSSGNAYVTGRTSGGLNGNVLIGTGDAFLAKYSSDGNLSYVKQLGVDNGKTDAFGITHDSSGRVYITGGTTSGLNGNTVTGTYDAFLAKFDSSGNLQ